MSVLSLLLLGWIVIRLFFFINGKKYGTEKKAAVELVYGWMVEEDGEVSSCRKLANVASTVGHVSMLSIVMINCVKESDDA